MVQRDQGRQCIWVLGRIGISLFKSLEIEIKQSNQRNRIFIEQLKSNGDVRQKHVLYGSITAMDQRL
jgi:hypothetical protein